MEVIEAVRKMGEAIKVTENVCDEGGNKVQRERGRRQRRATRRKEVGRKRVN